MTQSERATAVLNYLEGLDTKTVINILNPMLDDEALELVYLGLVRDGVLEGDDDEEEKSEIDKAVGYVRENMDEDDMAILKAEIDRCYKLHLIPAENVMDCCGVTDLLDEYAEENGLPER